MLDDGSRRLGYFFRQSLVKISLPRLERLEMLGCAETPTKAEATAGVQEVLLAMASNLIENKNKENNIYLSIYLSIYL